MSRASKKKILFLCTGNSARSQMAEGLARHFSGGRLEVHSAGLEPKGLHPLAVAAMDELGIDIRGQRSKAVDPDLLNQMDLVITVCGNAEARCPVTPPGIRREHWPLDDPAGTEGGEAERLAVFRNTRETLRKRITGLIDQWLSESASLTNPGAPG